MLGSIFYLVSYLLLGIFVVAFLLRSVRLARLPIHLRWELAPVPHEKGKGHYGGSYFEELDWWTKKREKSLSAELVYMFWEIVFLKGIFENNRGLWYFSFPFHFGLYLLIAALPALALAVVLSVTGTVPPILPLVVIGLAGAGFALGTFGAAGLFIKRLVNPQLKPMNTPESMFNLALLLAVFLTGAWAGLADGSFVWQLREFTRAFLTADFAAAPPPAIAVHAVVTLAFLAYLPFTGMMHFVAKYFTYHQVRWDDAPLVHGSKEEKEVLALLQQKVSWAGPHLHADGKKNWVDIAMEEN